MPTETKMTVEEFEKEQAELREKFETAAQSRLKELEPLVQERDQLLEALGLNQEPESPSTPARRGGQTTRRKGRKGGRLDQFVQVVADTPGITVSEAARRLKMKPNYLYRLKARAEEEGRIVSDGKGLKVK